MKNTIQTGTANAVENSVLSEAFVKLFGEHFLEETQVIGNIAVEYAEQNRTDLCDSIDAAIDIYYDMKRVISKFSKT